MLTPDDFFERITITLAAMASSPRNLRAYLKQPGPDFDEARPSEIEDMISQLLSPDANAESRLRFSTALRSWDNAKDVRWASETARNTTARRLRIHELLGSDRALERQIDSLIPFFHLEEPLIIAAEHEEWYKPQIGIRDYYWSTYVHYLRARRGWSEESLLSMDNHTRAILECLANPEAGSAYAARGLVMGFVQSGKTANFTGVVARAADAGYRLIIVLAGTWNILRNQTQRRFDKELLGKELLKNDEGYSLQPPLDWQEFLEHGTDPSELGHYTWQRLTRPDIDFQRLKAAIDHLEFEKQAKDLPLYDPRNLHSLPTKLLVVKKHSGILRNLVKDLGLIRTRLADLPTLIIDDESDQAGLNTVNPKKPPKNGDERSKTNKAIVDLLSLFPRGQYVGYTATPYANAVVNPNDPEDLFPKDFILPLDRPPGYMGIADFFDPETVYSDLKKDDFSLPEIAFIRRVSSQVGSDDEDLKRALRSYVLSGAIKLFRLQADPARYKADNFRHHTMLIHTSQLVGEMVSIADRVKGLWDQCAFNTSQGLADLQQLWHDDYAKVAEAKSTDLVPSNFEELHPFLSASIKQIEKGQKVYIVVNSDTADAPDFNAASVWKIIIGGNKLSRGYTVEGLTVSYYRRVAGTADTLMQMGRWFGFRPGYRDLVRVFLGVKDGKAGNSDLVSLFKGVCRMEERFRNDIRRYVRRPGERRVTPREVPPLISMAGALPPTAKNKMFNAEIKSKNFGGQRSMLTLAPTKKTAMTANIGSVAQLLAKGKTLGMLTLGGKTANRTIATKCAVYEVTTQQVTSFLKAYKWLESEYPAGERPTETNLQIEFLEAQPHEISSWLIVAPQRSKSFGKPQTLSGVGDLSVKERHRDDGRGFQVFGEPEHRIVAERLTEVSSNKDPLTIVNAETAALECPHRGVVLLYLVREAEDGDVSVGFELYFPNNKIPFEVNFTVKKKSQAAAVIVGP